MNPFGFFFVSARIGVDRFLVVRFVRMQMQIAAHSPAQMRNQSKCNERKIPEWKLSGLTNALRNSHIRTCIRLMRCVHVCVFRVRDVVEQFSGSQ